MDLPLAERIRNEALRRLVALEPAGASDLRVSEDGDAFVIEGTVDAAFGKDIVERTARELAHGRPVRSRLRVKDDLGLEGAAMETEFASGDAWPTKSIPRPEQ